MQRKQNELFAACQNMCPADTKRLLQEGVDPNSRDEDGNTPLFYAAIKGDFDSVDYLCAAGGDINIKNRFSKTPLIYLFHHNPGQELYLYQLLLAKGANPYFQDRSGSTLFDLAQRSYFKPILGILKEWENDNWKMANELKKKAAESEPVEKVSPDIQAYVQREMKKNYPKEEKTQPTESIKLLDNNVSVILAQPFIASPIHTASLSSKNPAGNIKLTHGPVQITFEIRAGTSDWRLAVINTKQTVKGDYSLIYDGKHDKKDISQIQNYLAEDNISGLTAYIDGHGESARAIAQYLRGEIQIKSSDAVKLNP